MKQLVNVEEAKSLITGEAITLSAVMAICAVALISVVAYRLFMSNKGTTTIPGGWKFVWN